MQALPFYLSLLFGALILALEAHRLFYESKLKKVISNGRFPILESVELDDLSPRRAQTRGWLFYICLYLLIFGTAVSAAEMGDYLYTASQSEQQSGGQGPVPTRAELNAFLDGGGHARPLAIALAMIALMSARSQAGRSVRAVESALRNYAHRLAGIPHSIYRLITRLNNIDYGKAMAESEAAHFQVFEKVRGRVSNAIAESAMLRQRLDETSNNLLAIDVLMPSVVSDNVFPVEVTEGLARLLDRQVSECKALAEALEITVSGRDQELTQDQVRALSENVQDCLRNLKAVFAVLYSQSDPEKISKSYPQITYVVERLKQPDRFRLKDKAVLAILVTTVVFFVPYLVVDIVRTDVTPLADMGNDLQPLIQESLNATVAFLVQAVVLLAVATQSSVAVRRAALDREDWKAYTLENLPIIRLLRAGFWPAVLSALAVFAANVGVDLVYIAYSENGLPSVSNLVQSISFHLRYVGVFAPLGLIISLAVLLVADLHSRFVAWKTVTLAAAHCVPFLMVAAAGYLLLVPSVSSALRELIALTLYALMVLCCFAWLVERSESDVDEVG